MSDKLFLGIDGGGSKTAFVIINNENETVFYNECGPSSLDTVDQQTFINTLNNGVKNCPLKVDAIFAGIGGVASQPQIEFVKSVLKQLPVAKEDTMVDAGNDVLNALYGGLNGQDGMILIAGTGSVCFGKHLGKYARAGGYCYQEGDAGSAYDLGYKALQHLARVIDHRHEETPFSKALMEYTHCDDYESFAAYMVNVSRTDVAHIAPIVTKYQDDKYASLIIKQAVSEVLLMIRTVYTQLHFEGKTLFSIIGSLGNADTLYKKLLMDGLKDISNEIVFVGKMNEAYIGSALKAKEEI